MPTPGGDKSGCNFVLIQTDEPEIRARQRHLAKLMMDAYPEVFGEQLVHLFELKLGRRLDSDEHRVLHERLARLGSDRLDEVVIDLDAAALAAWLADADAQ